MTNQELQTYDLFIHPLDLKDLQTDVWNDEPVPASLFINGTRYPAFVAYRGSHIREYKKKSYQISSTKKGTIKGRKEFHLNAEFQDDSLMRNKVSLDFFRTIGVVAPSSKHIVLKLNGTTEGIYLQLDSVDSVFLKQNGMPNGSIFYAIDDDANFSLISSFTDQPKKSLVQGYEQKCGTSKDKQKLAELIYALNVTERAHFQEEIEKRLDTEKYLRWLAGVVCTQNYDGFVHNYSLYLNGETNLFEIMPWDFDATWGRDINGREMPFDYVRLQGFNTLSARLLDLPIYRTRYMDIMDSILSDAFLPTTIEKKVMGLHEKLLPFVENDPYMKSGISGFKSEATMIIEFVKERNRYLRMELDKWAASLGKS